MEPLTRFTMTTNDPSATRNDYYDKGTYPLCAYSLVFTYVFTHVFTEG